MLLNYSKGDTLTISLKRGREPFSVQLRPQVLDRQAGLGLLNWRWGFLPGAETGGGVALGDVRQGSPASRLGLKPGDVVLQVGNTRIQKQEDLVTAFFRYQMHNALILSVTRGGQVYNVRMKI
jgi:S1-C subfamily serine protease